MAIDTREKRFSALNFGDGNHWHATFEADGAVDADDRAHLLDLYAGIALAAPTVAGPGTVTPAFTGATLTAGCDGATITTGYA